jgi:sulfatase maturation enzyme AslB (radical SAM superfamily)
MFNKKVLCLGNNTQSTDDLVNIMASIVDAKNLGLISDETFVPAINGYYHTTLTDLSFGAIVDLAKHFDEIVLLDQPKEDWDHWKSLLSTYKLAVELETQGHSVTYKDNNNVKFITNFSEFVTSNKSFCIYPWIHLSDSTGQGQLTLCPRSPVAVTPWENVVNWKTNAEFTAIRQTMLAGELIPERCSVCYDYEANGVESYRQYETKEWISRLGINSIDDLEKITDPKFYDIRLSNKCNIMCRSCKPEYSHLIERENRKYKTYPITQRSFKYSNLDRINIESLDHDCQVYLTGGEPTVISDVYRFMEKCIALGRTDFDFTLGTNAHKISDKFFELSSHFSNMNFSVSLDGYGRINDYWRWGSDWESIVRNAKTLESMGHSISINTVPGIYNVTNLHLLYEFLDREFPKTTVYLQYNYEPAQSVWNHPNAELVVESMQRCKQTKMYYSDGKSNKTMIDSIYDHYSNNPTFDPEMLKQFFEFNDKLDKTRDSFLGDYIPELEECRKLIKM